MEDASNNTWKICCSQSDPDALKFLVMIGISFIILMFCIFELSTKPESPDRTIYFSILSSVISMWIQPPQLPKRPTASAIQQQPASPISKTVEE